MLRRGREFRRGGDGGRLGGRGGGFLCRQLCRLLRENLLEVMEEGGETGGEVELGELDPDADPVMNDGKPSHVQAGDLVEDLVDLTFDASETLAVFDRVVGAELLPFGVDDPRALVFVAVGEWRVGDGERVLGPNDLELVEGGLAPTLLVPRLGTTASLERVERDDLDRSPGLERFLAGVELVAERLESLHAGSELREETLLAALVRVEAGRLAELALEGLDEIPDLGRRRVLADASERELEPEEELVELLLTLEPLGLVAHFGRLHGDLEHGGVGGGLPDRAGEVLDLGQGLVAIGLVQGARETRLAGWRAPVITARAAITGGEREAWPLDRRPHEGVNDRDLAWTRGDDHGRAGPCRHLESRTDGDGRFAESRRFVFVLEAEVLENLVEPAVGRAGLVQAHLTGGLFECRFHAVDLGEDDEHGKRHAADLHLRADRKGPRALRAVSHQRRLLLHVAFLQEKVGVVRNDRKNYQK